MQEERFLRRTEVCEMVGLARSSIYRLISAGSFPRPVQVGPKAVRWRLADIRNFMRSRQLTKETTEV